MVYTQGHKGLLKPSKDSHTWHVVHCIVRQLHLNILIFRSEFHIHSLHQMETRPGPDPRSPALPHLNLLLRHLPYCLAQLPSRETILHCRPVRQLLAGRASIQELVPLLAEPHLHLPGYSGKVQSQCVVRTTGVAYSSGQCGLSLRRRRRSHCGRRLRPRSQRRGCGARGPLPRPRGISCPGCPRAGRRACRDTP